MVSNPFYDYVFKAPNSLPYRNYRDFIQEQIESCRKYGMGAFINFRLNDAHMIMKTTPDLANIAFASPLYIEHPEYALGKSRATRINTYTFWIGGIKRCGTIG